MARAGARAASHTSRARSALGGFMTAGRKCSACSWEPQRCVSGGGGARGGGSGPPLELGTS
eukprot:5881109-Pyramimonas_sp.AAC.1